MPFTFSHPAAVLPLTYLPKRWFSLTGLVIGSLTPDFEYFIRMRVHSSFSHTLTGLFWFDLPLTIILAFVFHSVVRNRLIDNLPYFLQARLLSFKEFKWTSYLKKNLLVVISSCMIGAATHILWDGFTHQHGYFVQTNDSLQQSFFIAELSIPVYKILQHSSSLVGGLLIVYAIWKLPICSLDRKEIKWSYWISIVFIALVVLSLRALIGDNVVLGNMIASAITGGLIGLILTPVVLSWSDNGR